MLQHVRFLPVYGTELEDNGTVSSGCFSAFFAITRI